MFARFRPTGCVPYEHVFCSTWTSALTQRARDALSLTRAFLLLEDEESHDWEVGREELVTIYHEPAWAHAHRAPLCRRHTSRRGGQPVPPPLPCLCPIARSGPSGPSNPSSPSGARPRHDSTNRFDAACARKPPQRGSSITTGSSRLAIDL